jgi:sorting nexin-1/2
MSSVSKHTTALVKHNRVMANALFEFGQAFTWLGQSEGDALGAALTQMGNTADQLSVLATENAEAESIFLDEPLEEYVRLLSSVKIAMKRRQDKKNAYVNAILDLEAKQAAYNKVLGVSGKEETVNAKLALVEKSQSLVDTTRVEYEEVSERLLEEFDRFKREKAEDMKQILLNYVNLQVPHLSLPLSPLLCLSLSLSRPFPSSHSLLNLRSSSTRRLRNLGVTSCLI